MKYVKIELPDDFERGNCEFCPFGYEESYYDEDDGYDYFWHCNLGFDSECLLKIKEE